ncbi:PREDICTED: adenylate kinase 9 [Cariama cristata]|uniref:adenylate kinase 9 n=1 Tax=Cariama cristata TaxID=54380 RepID=UPI000520FD48|nr:PREDICTED: adenylate kinase 9 [Cariama cristata]
MASQEEKQVQPFADIFDEDEAEKSFLLSKPTCLIILGKPGSGKKTLARKLAQTWKCIFIEALELIQMNIHEETEYGLKCQELLFKGQSIPEELVTEMILKKIESPEVAHFGYVLSGFPSLSEEYMTVSQQIEKIKNLKLKPDFLINIKCSDYDLCQRISGQRQHPDSGQIYQRNQWDPNIIEKHKKEKDQHEEENEEDEEQEEEEAAEDPLMMSEFLHQLVQRPEDILENAEERVGMYKAIMLHPLEDLMAEQDCQYVIEVDGNQKPDDLFVSVVVRLQSLGVRNGAPITRLQSRQEEMLEGLENDELFRLLSSYKLIAHRYRWRRSKWGQACPVALKEGDIVMGKPDLAVSFLGKMYVLSSPEALKTFMLNPRPYLLPPMPLPPCKVLVFGPPFSGRTTICNLIAHKYKGKVLDMAKLIQPRMEESREKNIEQVRRDTVEKAITAVKNRLELEKDSRESGDLQKHSSAKKVDDSEEPTKTRQGVNLEEGTTINLPSPKKVKKITADHPEVQAVVEEAIKSASASKVTLSPEIHAEVLERAIAELMKKNKDRFPGAPEKGGWVVDNYPLSVDHWSALSERGLLPDTVVCLKDTQKDEIILPDFAEDDFPDIPEMEIIKGKIDLFMHDWQIVESEIKQSSLVQVVVLEIAEQTPESLLNQTVLVMEKPFKYNSWELSAEDLDEEAEDLAAEGEDEEVEEEENENEEAPPLRVCLLGTHGAGKTTCARQIADKLGIFHIQFEEYLQELILPKTKEKVGPRFEKEPEEDDNKMPILSQELEDFSQTMTKTVTEKRKQEVALTGEEEAIKANLMDNEALPPEVLDNIVLDWWRKEPFRSTGFILDGFPRTLDEAQYLSERGLCPDVAVYIQVEQSDVLDRLFPPCLKKWKERQYKKMENKKKLKDMKAKIRDERIARRREELLAEQTQKKQEALANMAHYEATEEVDKKENEDVEAILEEEFLEKEEEEEAEEQEIDAVDRIQNEIAEKFDSEIDHLQGVQEELEKLLIPQIKINGGRKPHIVCYQIYSKLNSLMENRGSIFEKCYPISLSLAHKMLFFSYKFPSSFGQWDPIKLSEGDVIKPQQSQENRVFPVIHRQYIYFFSSKENKETFMKNPIKYIRQPKPKPAVPVKIAIVGPPKSGKTTVAKKFASLYGLLHLSMGNAIRLVLNNQPESELALMLKRHLHKGLTVPDELAIQALDVALMNHVCNTTGVVIDGYPVTRKQVNLLESARIIPVKIFELEMDAKEMFRRALLDKESTNRAPYPEHDSSQILAIKNSCYKQHIDAIRTYYKKEHQNWCVIDAFQSKWWIWNKVLQEVQGVVKEIQIYLERTREGKAASIADLCITPEELQYRLGEFGQYCPVTLAEKGELVDCSVTLSLQFAAEFRGHYYKMASQEELDKFLSRPEVYVPPLASHPLPPPDLLPRKLTAAEVKVLFPRSAEMQGYCPVTYLDGKQRYEALVPGNIEYAAKYQDKVYIFESEEKLLKFMRLPEKYWNLKLPHKLPPVKKPILLTALPLAGYLEQGVATSLIKALNEVGCLKPKFPFLSVKKTALLFVACHLKAHNPRSSEPARQRYQRELGRFKEHCQLIPYLGAAMAGPYREPRHRPLGFDGRLQTFLSLKDACPGLVQRGLRVFPPSRTSLD